MARVTRRVLALPVTVVIAIAAAITLSTAPVSATGASDSNRHSGERSITYSHQAMSILPSPSLSATKPNPGTAADAQASAPRPAIADDSAQTAVAGADLATSGAPEIVTKAQARSSCASVSVNVRAGAGVNVQVNVGDNCPVVAIAPQLSTTEPVSPTKVKASTTRSNNVSNTSPNNHQTSPSHSITRQAPYFTGKADNDRHAISDGHPIGTGDRHGHQCGRRRGWSNAHPDAGDRDPVRGVSPAEPGQSRHVLTWSDHANHHRVGSRGADGESIRGPHATRRGDRQHDAARSERQLAAGRPGRRVRTCCARAGDCERSARELAPALAAIGQRAARPAPQW